MSATANIISFEQEAAKREPSITIERGVDPNNPNRTAYRITGKNSWDVQEQIDALTAEVEAFVGTGYARFVGPHRIDVSKYVALGEVVLVRGQP